MQQAIHIGDVARRYAISIACLGLFLTVIVSGCGKPSMKDGFAEVWGTVTLDGKPLENAQVVFITAQGESFGRTDANGYYELQHTRTLKGAAIGPTTVKISTKPTFPDEDTTGLEYDPDTESYVKPERVPAKYNTETELKVEVTEDGGPYDFELRSQ